MSKLYSLKKGACLSLADGNLISKDSLGSFSYVATIIVFNLALDSGEPRQAAANVGVGSEPASPPIFAGVHVALGEDWLRAIPSCVPHGAATCVIAYTHAVRTGWSTAHCGERER